MPAQVLRTMRPAPEGFRQKKMRIQYRYKDTTCKQDFRDYCIKKYNSTVAPRNGTLQ